MPKLLVVETSPRAAQSVSRRLTATFVEAWRSAHPGGEVVGRDLARTEMPFVDLPWFRASLTPAQAQSPEMREAIRVSDGLVAELAAADHVAIGTPMYNYSVPAALKAYVDQIVRRGLTLGTDGKGLLRGKRCTVLMASGGAYTEGSPIRDFDLATPYLRMILKAIGIEDVTFVAAGGSKAVEMGEKSMEEFLAPFEPAAIAAART